VRARPVAFCKNLKKTKRTETILASDAESQSGRPGVCGYAEVTKDQNVALEERVMTRIRGNRRLHRSLPTEEKTNRRGIIVQLHHGAKEDTSEESP